METQATRRSEGYMAFTAGADPEVHCPYDKKSLPGWYNDWLHGWIQAAEDSKRRWFKRQKQLATESEWTALATGCPWYNPTEREPICEATKQVCTRETCAVQYFKEV